ncbi:MAG: hypothetical protein AAB608_00170 [Patescibacteria group bacterium]
MDQEKKKPLAEGDQVVAEVVTIFAAIAETYEGSYVASYHLTHHDAVLGASGLGYSGPDGKVKPTLALKLSDGRYVLTPQIVEISKNPEAEAKLREKALAKLTPAERAALMCGFHD